MRRHGTTSSSGSCSRITPSTAGRGGRGSDVGEGREALSADSVAVESKEDDRAFAGMLEAVAGTTEGAEVGVARTKRLSTVWRHDKNGTADSLRRKYK